MVVEESSCQRYIQPTFKPAPRRPIIIRKLRETGDGPVWLYKGDNIFRAPATSNYPILASIIDYIKLHPNRRYTRSIHPESHHREVRSLSRNTFPTIKDLFPYPIPPFNPKPVLPKDPLRVPIYAST